MPCGWCWPTSETDSCHSGTDPVGRRRRPGRCPDRHKGKLPAPLITLLSLIGPGVVNAAANMAKDSLQKINADALAKRDNLTAT